MACVFFDRELCLSEEGLASVAAALEVARASVRRRGASLIAVLVGREPAASEPLPDATLAVLQRRGGLDARSLFSVTPGHAPSLHRLCLALQEASQAYYKAEGVRAATKANLRVASETAVRTAFKAAVYAEFRQDWTAALQLYKLAYQLLVDAPGPTGEGRRWQRWYERLLVAERVHYKCATLLLHTGAVPEAVMQLQRHTVYHRRAPPGLPPGLHVALWGFLERQFSTFADLLMSPPLNQTERPAALFAAAAYAGLRRRQAYAAYADVWESVTPPPVSPGPYVGQFLREGSSQGLSDVEFTAWLASRELPSEHCSSNLALLTRSHALFKRHQAPRTLMALLLQMADEHLCSGDPESAQREASLAEASRARHGWPSLHSQTLVTLRECARRLSVHEQHREWSFALGCIPAVRDVPMDESVAVLSSALATLSTMDEGQRLRLPDTAVACVVGFSAATVKPGDGLRLVAALRLRAHLPASKLHVAGMLAGQAVALSPVAALRPGQGWQVFQADVVAPEGGVLSAASLEVELDEHLVIHCPLAASTEADVLPPAHPLAVGAMLVLRAGGLPGVTRTVAAAIPPSATLHIKSPTQQAFVGQLFPVDVKVSAADDVLHDAALRIQRVDVAAEVFTRGSDGALVPAHKDLPLANVSPGQHVTRTFLLRWAEPCAAQTLTVQLVCHTAHGVASSLDGVAPLPSVRDPFTLSATFSGAQGQHSLSPAGSAVAEAVLPHNEAVMLVVHAVAGGDLAVATFDLVAGPGWTVRPLTPLPETTALRAGDVLTMAFQVTGVTGVTGQSPGSVAITWSPADCTDGGVSQTVTKLDLPPVAVEEALVHVRLVWPQEVVVGKPAQVGIQVENKTPTQQDVELVVADAPGFVFAGDRKNLLSVLPRCTAEVRHVFVAHSVGWQHAPELAVVLPRYGARLVPAAARRNVLVRPSE